MPRTVKEEVRRKLLRPLARRGGGADRRALIAALQRLDDRALGEDILAQVREVVSKDRESRKSDAWKDPSTASRFVALARALYASRRISTQEYVYFAASPVHSVHEGRWLDGQYEKDLEGIHNAMDELRKAYGLSELEYWPVGEAPEEYARLDREYSAVLDRRFLETLREFGLNELGDLCERNTEEYDRLWERGRRSVFYQGELIPALRDVVIRYEEDARRAATAKGYSAAVTLLGAGVEGLLLLRCLRSKKKAGRTARELPKRFRPRYPDDPTTWNFDALIEVCFRAGWLPPVASAVADYNPAGLAHLLRLMRNHVHPGKHARDRAWIETDERDYRDAEAIYLILLFTLGHIRTRTEEKVA